MEKDNTFRPKRNNLKTRMLPSTLMTIGGTVAFLYSKIQGYSLTQVLLIVFITLLVFALIGTVIKSIVDQFNMNMSYSDYFAENGELVEKGSGLDDLKL